MGVPRLLAALSLVPALLFLLRWRDLPQFGMLLDDGVYYTSAQSLATGAGYRLSSFPGEPAATKYPPLYPALLSLAWRMDPAFPHNLGWAALLGWIWLPVSVALLWRYLRGAGFSARAAAAACVLTATNPFAAFFSANLMSETGFVALVLGTLVLVQSGRPSAAGLCAAAAFLTRTSSVVMLGAVPLWYLMRRDPRSAARFTLAMSPAVAGWFAWTALQRAPGGGADAVALYYTSYTALYRETLRAVDLGTMVGTNLQIGLMSIGRLLFLQFYDGLAGLGLAAWVGLLGCFALARLIRQEALRLGGMVAAALLALHLVWNFTPNERMLLPLVPFLWAGVGSLACDPGVKPRIPQWGKIALVAVLAAYQGIYGIAAYMHPLLEANVALASRRAEVMDWIGRNTPPAARVVAIRDAELYLRTGRKSLWNHMPTHIQYRRDAEGIWRHAAGTIDFAACHGATHFLEDPANFSTDLQPEQRARLRALHAADPRLRPVHSAAGGFVLYEIEGVRPEGWRTDLTSTPRRNSIP